VKTTTYFDTVVRQKHPEVRRDWIEWALAHPIRREVQLDGRIRYWGRPPDAGDRILRVVTLADGETVHNAFFDRGFKT
jgi:hypothetical protein